MNKKILYYVTTNAGKFAEVQDYFQRHMPSVTLEQFSADLPEIQSLDQLEIARDKANRAWALAQKPLLLDDAGIYFEKYRQFPGTLSKFVWQGIGFEGIKCLIDTGDRAFFLLFMMYCDGPESVYAFEGRCDGHLIKPDISDADPRLPYDTFFVPDGFDLSYAQIKKYNHDGRYDAVIYRLRALEKFITWYQLYA